MLVWGSSATFAISFNVRPSARLNYLKSHLVKAQNLAVIRLLERDYLSKSLPVTCVRLGSSYGGWYIPKQVLSPSEQKRLLISAGLGFDITFDLEMLKIGYTIVALDPYPPAYQYALTEFAKTNSPVHVFKVGLSAQVGTQLFFAPINPDHDSWSSANIQSTSHLYSREFEVTTLDGVFEKSGLVKKDFEIIVLKMDIEGAEEQVLRFIHHQNLAPNVIAAELDFLSLIPFLSIRRRIVKVKNSFRIFKELEAQGYVLVKTDNFNFTWISTDTLAFSSHDEG